MNIFEVSKFFQVEGYQQVSSTNDVLAELVRQGRGRDGLLVWAEQQTAGRGRHGRSWVSPKGNLYMSLLLKRKPNLQEAALVGFVASVSLAETLKNHVVTSDKVEIKWPNDLLIEQKKCAGILLEAITSPSIDGTDYIIVGIGVNITSHPDNLPYPATSLHRHVSSRAISPILILEGFCHAFLPRLVIWREGDFAGISQEWLRYACGVGKKIIVRMPDSKTKQGYFEGIDEKGYLLLKRQRRMEKIAVGEVFFPEEGI